MKFVLATCRPKPALTPGDALLADVPDNSDDRAAEAFRLFTIERNSFSECSAFVQKSFHKRLVYDRHLLPICSVARIVLTTGEQRYLQRLEVLAINCGNPDCRIFLSIKWRMSFNAHKSDQSVTLQG